MTGDRSQLTNFISKFLGTVKFGNDQVAKIMGYGDKSDVNFTKISRFITLKDLGIIYFLWDNSVIPNSKCFSVNTHAFLPQLEEVIGYQFLKQYAPEHAVSTASPSSTTIDQDAPSPSNMLPDKLQDIRLVTQWKLPMVEKSKQDEDKD
ncbi:hypothetical protein Tco_0672274 [Tanacetum coccineum]